MHPKLNLKSSFCANGCFSPFRGGGKHLPAVHDTCLHTQFLLVYNFHLLLFFLGCMHPMLFWATERERERETATPILAFRSSALLFLRRSVPYYLHTKAGRSRKLRSCAWPPPFLPSLECARMCLAVKRRRRLLFAHQGIEKTQRKEKCRYIGVRRCVCSHTLLKYEVEHALRE